MTKIHYYDVGAVEMMLDGAMMREAGSAEKAAVAQELTRRGLTGTEIAQRLWSTERSVVRWRGWHVEPMPDEEIYDMTEERARALENTAAMAMQLACDVRDDAAAAWDALVHMEPQQLRELCMTLGCMVPVDFTVKDLLGWLDEDEAVAPLRSVG